MEVATQFQEIVLLVHYDGLVSPLKQVSAPLPLDVCICRVGTVQVMHYPAQILLRCFDNQVIVVRHKNISVQKKTIFLLCFAQVFLESSVILPREEYLAPFITPRCNMINSPFIFYPHWPCHFSIPCSGFQGQFTP